jgi:hypothetical protein
MAMLTAARCRTRISCYHRINSHLAFTALYRHLATETTQLDLSPGAWGIGAVADSIPLENRYWYEKINNDQFSAFLNFRPLNRRRITVEAVAGLMPCLPAEMPNLPEQAPGRPPC